MAAAPFLPFPFSSASPSRIREPTRRSVFPPHHLAHFSVEEIDVLFDFLTALDEFLSLFELDVLVPPHVHPQLVEDIIKGGEHADEVTLWSMSSGI